MRILVDMASHVSGDPAIIQAEKTPAIGSATNINGKYAIPVPVGNLVINSDSYVLASGAIDGGDVVSLGYAKLLAQMPQFTRVYVNPLLTSDHFDELDFSGAFRTVLNPGDDPVDFYPRFKCSTPGNTAILPQNNTVAPARPGLVITENIDISPYFLNCNGNPSGASTFAVYWYLFDYSFTDDISADYGALAGTNAPAKRLLMETNQTPANFSVYLSTDSGANWCNVSLLGPVTFTSPSKTIKLAFLNRSSAPIYLASFAVFF